MHAKTTMLIKGGRVHDNAKDATVAANILIADGRIQELTSSEPPAEKVLDATDLLVAPGLIDLHVHLREPGGENKETLETGTKAAVAGGFTAVACMPNTQPPLDNLEIIKNLQNKARRDAHCKVYSIGCITKGRKGRQLADLAALADAGVIAFSDDGDGVADSALMAAAFEEASRMGRPIIQHCEDPGFPRGVMHQGKVSQELGMPGISPLAEEKMLARDLALLESCEALYHVTHISTADAVELVRRAKQRGLRVSADVCPHHLLLTDESCRSLDPNYKMHPPLRTQKDVEACIAGVIDGVIDFLSTDHAPHTPEEKARGFMEAPAGVIGLETSLALFAQALVEPGHIKWPTLIRLMSTTPAKLFGLEGGTLAAGGPADITIIDPDEVWTVEPQKFHSKARNCPFAGMTVKGRAVCTLVDGMVKYDIRRAK